MVTMWAIIAAVGVSGQPPRPSLTPPEAETVPVFKVPGPAFKIPCRVPDRTRGVVGVELWASLDNGKSWAKAGVLSWSDADADGKEFEFHAKKSGEHWFATRVKFKDGRHEPEKVSELEPAQRVFVAAGSEPVAAPKAALTPAAINELDDELNRVEIELIRKEMKRLAGSKELTVEVADRIDQLRSRLRELRLQTERAQDRIGDLRTVPLPPVPDTEPRRQREQLFPDPPANPTSPAIPSVPPPRPRE